MKVAFQVHKGQYFKAAGGGGGLVLATGEKIKNWEIFELIQNDDGTITLKAHKDYYVTAENGNGELVATRPTTQPIGNWEKFTVVSQQGGKVALKAKNGGYVRAQGGGGGKLIADSAAIKAWERFEKKKVKGGGGKRA